MRLGTESGRGFVWKPFYLKVANSGNNHKNLGQGKIASSGYLKIGWARPGSCLVMLKVHQAAW